MATAVVEERQLLKSLRWWDGFTIALCNPGFLLGSLLGAYGALGVTGATVLWGISAVVSLLNVWVYSELAMMFPGRSGGISLYANEGWRKYTTLVGPLATFGYWIGWSVVLAIFGNLIGSLIQAQWFSSTNWDVYDGVVHLNLFNFIGIGCIVLVWVFNIFGIRLFAWFTYVTGVLMMIPLLVLMFGGFVSGRLALVQRALGAGQPPVGRRSRSRWCGCSSCSGRRMASRSARRSPRNTSPAGTQRSRCAAPGSSRCSSTSCCRSGSEESPEFLRRTPSWRARRT